MEYFDLTPEVRESLARLVPTPYPPIKIFDTTEEAMADMAQFRAIILKENGGVVWEGWCDNPDCPLQSHAIQSYEGKCTCNTCGAPIILKRVCEQVTVQ